MTTAEETKQLAPWTNTVPKDWQVTRLDAAADVLFSNVDKHTIEGEKPVRLCNYVDVYKNDRITAGIGFMEASAEEREIRKFQIRRGDILATKDSEEADDIAIPSLVAEELPGVLCGYHLAMIRPRLVSVSGSYLAWLHASKSFRAQYEAKAVGVTRFGLSQYAFRAARIPLPPLPEQQRIAAYLDASCAAIDAAVAAKRRQLETLDSLRKSAAHQVLSEGLRPGLPLNDSGIESIGVIPAHWDVKQIRYACEVNYGITLQLEKGQSVGDGVRILTVSNLTIDGNLDLEDEYYIDPALLTKADYLRRGDLLFNWRNGSRYHVGKTAFFDMEGEVAHVSFLLRIRCGRHMNPFFMRSYLGVLKDAGFFAGAKDKVNKTFNSTELKRLRVVIPPLDEQEEVCREIERRNKECNDVKAAIEAQIATLTAYRKSLIHECVTGQRRITEAGLEKTQHTEATPLNAHQY
ncbi:MAG: restriction endonuclease subunit S [Verrucomicrobiota bacterium]